MIRYLLLIVFGITLNAGIMDFQTIADAQAAYQAGQYDEAANLFSQVADKNDEARFDYANSLYKSSKYRPAIDEYDKISDKSVLKAQALYNAGNAHAQLGELDFAEQAYSNALKVAKNENLKRDIEHNLEVVKKAKQNKQDQQDQNKQNDQKNKDQKNDQQQNDQKQNQDGKGQDQKQNQDQKAQNDQQKQDQQGKQNENKKDDRQDAKEKDSKSEQQKAQQAAEAKQDEKRDEAQQAEAQAAMAEPISDMEERKYNKMLDKRGIKTLMIPLSGKGAPRDDETTPW